MSQAALYSIRQAALYSTKQWDLGAAKAEALAKLDALEARYWDAWRNSNANADYLAGVHSCIEKRCQLLGLNTPIKAECETNKGPD